MGSIDIPPFLREKMKQKVQAKKEPEIPPFMQTEETPKKKVGTIGLEESSLQAGNVLSQSGGVGGEEIPKVEKNDIDIALEYGKLKGATKWGATPSSGKAGEVFGEIPDEEKRKAANKLAQDFNKVDLDGLSQEFSDFPEAAFERETTSKEALLKLRKENPIQYAARLNNAKTVYKIAEKSDIATANRFNQLADIDYGSLDGFISGKQQQQDIINQTLTGVDKEKATVRLKENASRFINSLNPDLVYEYENSDIKGIVDANQYAGLKTWEVFEPEKYKQAIAMLKEPIVPQYQYEINVTPEEKQKSITTDSALAAQYGGKLLQSTINQQIGKETILRQLNGQGLQNAAKDIQYRQYVLAQRNKTAKDDAEKFQIAQEYIQTENELAALTKSQKDEDAKYPYTAQLKFDQQVKDITLDRGASVGELMYNRYAHGIGSTVDAGEDLATTLFGSESDKAKLRNKRIGEQKVFEGSVYLPPNEQRINPEEIIVSSDELKKKVNGLLNGRSLNSLSEQERKKVNDLVAANQDQIETITNPEAGKSKNFFSKATALSVSSFTSDIAAFMTNMGMLKGVGLGGKLAEATTLFKDGYTEAFNKKINEGASINSANEYGLLHGGILALMAKFGSKYEAVQNILKGGKSPMAKKIAGMSEETWNNIYNENKGIISRLASSSKNIAKEQGKMIGTFGIAAPTLSSLADNAFYDQHKSVSQMASEAATSAEEMLVGSLGFIAAGLAKGAMKPKATPLEKAALWELGDNPELGKAKIDEAVKLNDLTKEDGERRKGTIDKVSKLIEKVPTKNDKNIPLTDNQKTNYLYNLLVKENAKDEAKSLPEKQAEVKEKEGLVADFNNQILLSNSTEKQLTNRKEELEKQLNEKDDKGKLVISDQDKIKVEAEIEAIDSHLDTTKKEVKEEELPDLSQPIPELNVDNKGIPIGENVPPEVKGEPEKITQPIELSVEGKTTDVVVDEKTKQQLLDERFNKIKQIKDKAEGTREDRTKRYKELVNELGDETAALKKLQEEINARAKKEIDKLPELPKTENEVINEKGENDFEKIKKDLGFKSNDYSWGKSPMDEDMGDMLLSKDKESVIFIKPNEVEVYDEKNDQTDTITNGIKIELVSTKENSRGKGKAKEMIQKVTDWADKNGTDLHLDIAPQDKATTDSGLKKLYESFGFEFDGIHGIRKPKQSLSKQDKASNVLGKPSERKNNGLSFPINKNGKEVGSIVVSKRKGEGYSVAVVSMIETEQGKGLGKDAYRELNKKSIEDTGKPLRSGITINDKAKNLWESLVKIGEAEKINDESYQFKAVDQPLSKQESGGKAPVTKPEGKSDVVVDKASNVGGDVRTINDFANENESYRVIVGDEAFNDIIESGVVRTNADSKSKKEGGIDLGNRPTAFPSFSRGKASIEYAAENPNNYIIVTEDGSIQPSKSGRHGKGTTMFPTDENGNHLKELSGEKIKVYKHIGDGKYELVYENGKAVDQPLSKQESGVVGSEVITDKGKMGGAVTDKIEVNDVEVALPEKGFVISDVTLNEGEAKYKGSGQEIYKKALDEHGTLYSSFPISEDAMRVQNKLVEKGIAKIENITLSDGTEIRKITKAETKTGQGVPETETGDSGEKPPVDTEAGIYAEDKRTELSFRGLQEVATEFGLDDVNSRERKSDLQLFKDAETEIKKWVNEGSYQKNIETVIKDAAERKPISDTQRVILENHIHAERVKANEIAKQNGVNSKEFKDAVNEIDRITKAAITSRQEAGAALRIPTTANNNTASLADAIIATKESKNVSELTDTETAEVQKKYQAIEDANAKFQEYKAEAEAKFKEYQAKIEMLEAGKNTQKGKKTATDLKTEREDIKKSILEKWNKAKNVGIVNNPKEDLLIQLAPDIAKLMRNYYQDGVRQLGEMVDKIHTYLKDLGVGVEASDVQDMIAGKYNQKKLTKNEMVAEIKGLQDEAKALNELKSLMNKEPRNEKEKRKKNERLAEIRKQINALKKEQGLDQYSDQAKVDRAIAANKAKEEKFKEKLAKGDFEKQPKHKTIYEAKEWQRQNPSLYKKLLDSQAKADQARADFEAGLIENEMKNAGLGDKFRAIAKKSSGTLKQLFASFDLSAIAVQNLPFILTQPKTSAKGLPKSFVHMVSQKQFDRMITELHNSPDWQIIKDSGLRVTEPKSLLEATREDYFPDRFKAIVKINGKEYGWVNVGGHKYELLDLSKPFERQFTSLGNLLRVVKFRTEAEILKSKGITFENSPEEYKTLAKRLNNLTSSSDIPAAYQNEITRTMIWSSRLVAAKLNMLGISDVAALIPGTGVKKGYYRGLGVKGQKISRQQAMAVYDLAKFATSVIALTYLVALIKGGTVNTNPTSNQFMDVEYDDGKSMNLTGGFSPYIAKLFQFANWGKTDKYGVFKPYKGTDPIKESITFMASKAPPVTRSVENIVAGKDQFGQDSDVSTEASKYKMPLAIGQIYDQIQKDGAGALFTEGIPTLIGFNSKDNRNYNTHNFSKDTEKFIVENQVPISMPKKVYTKNGEKMEMTEDEYKDLLKQVDKEIDNIASDIKNNGGYVIRNKEIVELPYSKLTKDEIAEMTKEMITEATAQIRKDKFKTDEETEEYIEKSTLEEILRQTRKASQESKPKKPEK